MKIVSEAMNGGFIPDRFGKRGTQINKYGIPDCSIPFSIEDAPEKTRTFALVLEDKDAVPVCGFSWIHWIAANIKKTEIPENDSVGANDYVQGINSWFGSNGAEGALGYGGMTPPDAPHKYELHVFALDAELNLEQGFFMNELYHAMEGHVLAQTTVTGVYQN